jgi:hypothetical protein
MTIKQCDRCGTIIENMHDGYLLTVNYPNSFGQAYYDLCDDCYAEFNEFMITKSKDKK